MEKDLNLICTNVNGTCMALIRNTCDGVLVGQKCKKKIDGDKSYVASLMMERLIETPPNQQPQNPYKELLKAANERDQENEKIILGYQTIIKNKYKIIARQKTWLAILAVSWLASLVVIVILAVVK